MFCLVRWKLQWEHMSGIGYEENESFPVLTSGATVHALAHYKQGCDRIHFVVSSILDRKSVV